MPPLPHAPLAQAVARLGHGIRHLNARESLLSLHHPATPDRPLHAAHHESFCCLELDAGPFPVASAADIGDWLERLCRWNSLLDGGAKFAWTRPGIIELRAEIPMADASGFSVRLESAVAGLLDGWTRFHSTAPPDPVKPASGTAAPAPSPDPAELKSLCAEAGWPCDTRGDGTLVFDVARRGCPRHGILSGNGAAGYLAAVELARVGAWDPVCARALQFLLLRLNGLIRGARASWVSDGDATVARLESPLPPAPSGHELNAALESLSIGADQCAEEARALSCPQVAREYLEVGMDLFTAG